MKMTNLQRWLLKKVFRSLVQQGPHHTDNIREVQELLTDAAGAEFYEDNIRTLHNFMLEQFTDGFVAAVTVRERMSDQQVRDLL